MPVEARYDYITDLDKTSPTGPEPVNQGDDHLRGIKSVLTNQFPMLGEKIVSADADQITAAALRKIGAGGMHLQQPNTTFTIPANGVWRDFTETSGATPYASLYATGNPATGIITIHDIAASFVRIHATLSIRRSDASQVSSTAMQRCRIKRLSNDTYLDTAFITLGIPLSTETIVFVLEGIDVSPQAQGEQYIMEINQDDNNILSYFLINYNFWVEPIGT